MDLIKFYALGGLDEDGRNMSVIEINDELYIVDVGLKYPENETLGVESQIPDFSHVLKNKENVKGIFITHGHDDVMGALPYLMKELKAPIYTTPLIALMIQDLLREHKIKNTKIFRIKKNGRFKVQGRNCVAFALTHSIPDSMGIAIETDQGYIVHSSEFIMDFNVPSEAFTMDLSTISELGKKGVFMLFAESVYAKRQGFTSPHHRIEQRIEKVFENTEERIFVTLYEQNIYRLIEVIEMARKFKRRVYIYGEKQRRLIKHLEALNYYKMPEGMEISSKEFNNDMKDVVIVVSDIGPDVFRKMGKIAMGEDQVIEIKETDHVIVASPQVPGTESVASEMTNELFKDGVSITSMNPKEVLSMHASIEDLKMMMALLKPKYYVPIKGEFQDLTANADLAFDMGIPPTNIIVLDNGQIAEFVDGRLKSTSQTFKLESVLIDGKDHLDTSGLVLRDRKILGTDGAITVGVVMDHRTKKIIGGPDVQSRGVVYLKDAKNLMNEAGKILVSTIEKNVKENKYEHIETRNEARDKISKFIFKETGKRPMIMPVIIELR
ncbi:ribonuclease J [Erysipelothrix urinaevulpis]|uniref:ribonuclease J n=1 Tax=Erysipelothrix urinaevulpis TaxID=2683717 RepID=UPI00135884DC|nr:ribonuclease J [Erysipelothrix urinaevulpis]